jgi:hypothetical protein
MRIDGPRRSKPSGQRGYIFGKHLTPLDLNDQTSAVDNGGHRDATGSREDTHQALGRPGRWKGHTCSGLVLLGDLELCINRNAQQAQASRAVLDPKLLHFGSLLAAKGAPARPPIDHRDATLNMGRRQNFASQRCDGGPADRLAQAQGRGT